MEMQHKQTSSSIHYFVSDNDTQNRKGAMLFLHPAFANHHAFDDQIHFFSKEYTVITMDFLGYGLSRGFQTKERIHDSHGHIHEILVTEGIQKIHLVGVSLGGLLAQDFANRHPGKVASLSAVGAYDINDYDPSTEKAQRKIQIAFLMKALLSMRWFHKSTAKVSSFTEPAQHRFYQMNRQMKRSSLRYMATLGKIMNQSKAVYEFPLCILYGEHDTELAIQLSQRWYSNHTGSKLIVIHDAGHCANMDNPEEFNEAVMSFLNEVTNE